MIVAFIALLAFSKATSAIHATTDIYYHEHAHRLSKSMWVFSSQGLSILSVDGSQTLNTLSAADMDCGDSCNYFDVVSDGRKYVWANALHATPHRVDVFSLETGNYLGGVATCNTPLDTDYIPNREELWVRCAEPADLDDPESGHMAVIQVNSLSGVSKQVRLMDDRAYGYSVFHASLGNYGYATANNANVIWKVDMANRMVVANYTMNLAHSAYDMTYSPANKHLFIRSRVCCTCGFDGADAGTCGRGPGQPGQNIQTGPSAGRSDLDGTCGVSCEGSPADTLGVLEFDTVSETFVGNHNPLVGFGATPAASPDGKYIVMFANDGGQNLRVLQAGDNGKASTVAFDVSLDFADVPPGREAISDFAFVQWKNHNLLALASGYDNDLALVDLSASPPNLFKLRLSNSASPTGGNGGRMVEWAYGSNYLWVDGSSAEEVYVIELSEDGDLTKARVGRTVTSVASHKIIYVENFAQRAELAMLSGMFVTADDAANGVKSEASSQGIADEVRNQLLEDGYLPEGDDEPSVVAIIALVLGSMSLLINLILTVRLLTIGDKKQSPEKTQESVTNNLEDEKTLGSKRVA